MTILDRGSTLHVYVMVVFLPYIGIGLSRTCEIFGAAQLVIANKKVLEDPLFLSLSVTSEKWLSIREARLHQFADVLVFTPEFLLFFFNIDGLFVGAVCRSARVPNYCQTAGFYPCWGGANS